MVLDPNNFLAKPMTGNSFITIYKPDGSVLHQISAQRITAVTTRDKLVQIHQASGEKPWVLQFATCEHALNSTVAINNVLNIIKAEEQKNINEASAERITWIDFRNLALNNRLNEHTWYHITDTDHGNFKLPAGPNKTYKCLVWNKNSKWIIIQNIESSIFYKINIIDSVSQPLDGTNVFIQMELNDNWVITHNLNKFPNLIIQSLDGLDTYYPSIEYINSNKISLKFSEKVSGTCYIN